MRPTRLLALAAVALLAACNGLMSDPARTDVVYEADRQAYAPQDEIVTSLRNTSQAEVGYNLCIATLEKQAGSAWARVERMPEHPCALVLFTLAPSETAEWREPASAVPGPGTYRLRTRIESPIADRRVDLVTEPFTLR